MENRHKVARAGENAAIGSCMPATGMAVAQTEKKEKLDAKFGELACFFVVCVRAC